MADALSLVLTNEPLGIRMGQNGRRLVLERFTWRAIAADFLTAFEDIIRGTRTSPALRDSYGAGEDVHCAQAEPITD